MPGSDSDSNINEEFVAPEERISVTDPAEFLYPLPVDAYIVSPDDWQNAFHEAERKLLLVGYTHDQLAPDGKQCIACLTSIYLRDALGIPRPTDTSVPPNDVGNGSSDPALD